MRAAAVIAAVAGLLAGCFTYDEDVGAMCISGVMDECYCPEGAVCDDLSCHGNDRCSLDCTAYAICEMNCEGADWRCDVHCGPGCSCVIDAANELTIVDCDTSTSCTVERCIADRCTVDCADKVAVRTGDIVQCQ